MRTSHTPQFSADDLQELLTKALTDKADRVRSENARDSTATTDEENDDEW